MIGYGSSNPYSSETPLRSSIRLSPSITRNVAQPRKLKSAISEVKWWQWVITFSSGCLAAPGRARRKHIIATGLTAGRVLPGKSRLSTSGVFSSLVLLGLKFRSVRFQKTHECVRNKSILAQVVERSIRSLASINGTIRVSARCVSSRTRTVEAPHGARPCISRTTNTITAITRRRWIKAPPTWPMNPSNQSTSRIINIVQSMRFVS
jgi:hypothetical protein